MRRCILSSRPSSWSLPFLIVADQRVEVAGRLLRARPAVSLPHGLYLNGLKDFWNRVNFGAEAAELDRHLAVRWPCSASILSVLNAYAIGIGRIKGSTWFLAFFVLANMLPQEALVYPLYYLSKQVGLYDTRLSVIIVFTVDPGGLRHLPALLRARPFPKEILEAARIDGAEQLADPVADGRPGQPAHPRRAAGLLLHLDLERVPASAGHADRPTTTRPCSVALGVLQGQRLMDATMTNAAGTARRRSPPSSSSSSSSGP